MVFWARDFLHHWSKLVRFNCIIYYDFDAHIDWCYSFNVKFWSTHNQSRWFFFLIESNATYTSHRNSYQTAGLVVAHILLLLLLLIFWWLWSAISCLSCCCDVLVQSNCRYHCFAPCYLCECLLYVCTLLEVAFSIDQ